MKIKKNTYIENYLIENEKITRNAMFFLKMLKLVHDMEEGSKIIMDQILTAECIVENDEKLVELRIVKPEPELEQNPETDWEINSQANMEMQAEHNFIEIDIFLEEEKVEFKHSFDMRKCEPVDLAEVFEMVSKHVREEANE